MTAFHNWFVSNSVLIQCIVPIFIGCCASLLIYILSYKLYPLYEKKKYHWHMAVAKALQTPAQIYIWLTVLLFSGSKFLLVLGFVPGKSFPSSVWTVEKTITAFFMFWLVMRCFSNVEKAMHQRAIDGVGRLKDRTQISAVTQICRVGTILLFVLVMMPIFGIPTAALLTFGGAATVVIGFATKDTMSNFLGGLMVYWDRPFSVGDWIRSPDKQIEGTVEEIGWRLTRIRTFDKRPLYIPNGFFSTISIENPSRMTNRRIKKNIGVRFSDATKIPAMLEAIQNMLKSHPEIDTNQTLMVNLFEFGESSLNFFIYTFTKTTNWVKFEGIQQDVLLKVYEVIRAHDADCAFPTRTLELPDGFCMEQLSAQEVS